MSLLLALGKFILLVAGIVGVGIRFFEKDGWLTQMLHDFMHGRFWSVGTLVLAVVLIFVVRDWIERAYAKKPSTALADVLTYGMMAAGAYFIFHLLTV